MWMEISFPETDRFIFGILATQLSKSGLPIFDSYHSFPKRCHRSKAFCLVDLSIPTTLEVLQVTTNPETNPEVSAEDFNMTNKHWRIERVQFKNPHIKHNQHIISPYLLVAEVRTSWLPASDVAWDPGTLDLTAEICSVTKWRNQ